VGARRRHRHRAALAGPRAFALVAALLLVATVLVGRGLRACEPLSPVSPPRVDVNLRPSPSPPAACRRDVGDAVQADGGSDERARVDGT
jgi:hypothetical protein